MKKHPFSGTGVALVTPFRGQEVDFSSLQRVIEHVIQGGVDYLVALGTTGEAITLSPQECRKVFDFILEQNAGRLPVVAGFFGSNNTARLVEATRNYNLDGFSAIMASSPAYNKPTQEGIFQHYTGLADASSLPIIIYNVPGRTASLIEADTILRLAESDPKFIAVKEASGDLQQAMTIAKHRPEHFALLSGDDPLTLPLLACGAQGVISVIANALPRVFSDMVRAGLAGDLAEARRLHYSILEVHPWLYIDGNPAGIKAALEMLGLCGKEVRLPLTSLRDVHYLALREAMEAAGVFKPVS